MEHEALPGLPFEALDLLCVFGGSQRAGDERLGLAAREHRGAVRPGQHARLDPDRPYLVERPAVETHAAFEDLVAQDLFLQILENLLGFQLPFDFAFRQVRDQVIEHLVDTVVVLELAADAHRLGQRDENFFLDLAVEVVADLLLGDLDLRLAGLGGEGVDDVDDLLDRVMRRVERLDDLLLGHFLRAGFDHHEAVFAAGHHQVELAVLPLLERGIDDVAAVHQADAHAGNRLLEGNLRQREGGRRAGNREDVGVVLRVGGQHERDDLGFEAPAGRKERADWPIDDPAGQDLFLRGLSFAFEESTGNAAGGVGVLAVVDREREKVDPFARRRRPAGRDEHDRIAEPHDDGTVRLLGELAGFKTKGLVAECEFSGSHKKI